MAHASRRHSRDVDDELTALMLRAQAGEGGAFETLVELVYPRLVAWFRRLGARPDEAEDGAQEVLLKIYRARANYVARARFTTYAFRVARNHWIDARRHQSIQPPTMSADASAGDDESSLAGRLPGAEAAPPRRLEDAELGQAIADAVAALPAPLREVWALSQVEGLRYEGIGEILGIPLGTVKSRAFAAVRRLRDWLSERGFEP